MTFTKHQQKVDFTRLIIDKSEHGVCDFTCLIIGSLAKGDPKVLWEAMNEASNRPTTKQNAKSLKIRNQLGTTVVKEPLKTSRRIRRHVSSYQFNKNGWGVVC